MPKNRRFFVYIVTNRPRSHTLYTGITGNLPHRIFQHKNKLIPGFTSKYNLILRRICLVRCSDLSREGN
jgi:predicted GIY-YIG superfamily endonuclease